MGALRWPFHGRRWFRRLVLMGLINLVPVAGMMDLLGWTMACLQNLREGRDELPPAGFQYLRRGWPLFAVLLLYWLVLTVGYAVFAVGGDIVGLPLDQPAGVLYYVLLFGITALTPAIVLATDRGGVRGGLAIREVLAEARSQARATLVAGGLTLLLAVIANLGLVLVGIGVLLTAAYTMPAWAAVIRRYEVATA
jgi:hypothetical protein